MMFGVGLLLAVLSIWDYPARQLQHESLRNELKTAVAAHDYVKMSSVCAQGVGLLPDDPVWHYNYACALARNGKSDEAFDELEAAIDLGFREVKIIATDGDLRMVAAHRRFDELLEYAKAMASRPVMLGPMAYVDATGVFGDNIALGEQNLGWNFDVGAFVAHLKLVENQAQGNTGDLYFNRDGGHANLNVKAFPGLTTVGLDSIGRGRKADLDIPNMLFPYPVFGNSSRAFLDDKYWRSIPRALMTTRSDRLKTMAKMYLSNQFWVFPAHRDHPPSGSFGDVFSSVAPYWMVSAGSSWSDLGCLRLALAASGALKRETKMAAVSRGVLAPTLMTLMRKAMVGVDGENGYLTAAAHPTAIDAAKIEVEKLKSAAASLAPHEVPPIAFIKAVDVGKIKTIPPLPELTYATPCAWAFVLRAGDSNRVFSVRAAGSPEYAFRVVHGPAEAVKLEHTATDTARVVIDRTLLSVTNRIDLAVFGRSTGTGWGAPAYVSFAVVDDTASYCDPYLLNVKPE